MAERMGYDGYVYYESGEYDGVNNGWAEEVVGVMDCRPVIEDGEADLTTRDMRGFEAVRQGLRKWAVELDIVWDPTKTSFTALRNAYLNRTVISLWILDGLGTTSGSQGPAGSFVVTGFNRRETAGEVMIAQVTCKLARNTSAAGAPEWVII